METVFMNNNLLDKINNDRINELTIEKIVFNPIDSEKLNRRAPEIPTTT